jgi:hypothetical protein
MSPTSNRTISFLDAANKAAKFKVYLWAREVFRETFVIFLRQIVVEQHIQERRQSHSNDPRNGRTIVVTEQNVDDANATVERLGYQWIQCLQESNQVDAEEAVRYALLRGNFVILDPEDGPTPSSSTMDCGSDHIDGDETKESLSVDHNPPSDTETIEDICGLYAMAKKRLQEVAATSHTDKPPTGIPYWHPLPGRFAANGLHIPQTTILPESITDQHSCYKTVTGIFGLPKPYLKPWNEDQWCQGLIRKLDQRHQGGNSQLPYSWNMVQKLTKAIPERLHFSSQKNVSRKNRGDIIEIVPKSITRRHDNENHSCDNVVESIYHNKDTESNSTTLESSHVLPRKNPTEEVDEEFKEQEPIPLGSAKFQERFAIKKRRKKRIREEEEQALQQETNYNSNCTTSSINNQNHPLLFREDEVRQPFELPEPLLLHWSDLDDDDLHDGGRNNLVPNPSGETICHTLQGALKNVGLFHEKVQSIIDRVGDSYHDGGRNMLATYSGKEGKKLRKERLGKLDNTVSLGGNLSDHISCNKKRGQAESSRVLRVVRKGEEWMEIDLGECLLQCDMATPEVDAISSSSNSKRSDTSSTSSFGENQRNSRYKLYAFRSLEISASLGD